MQSGQPAQTLFNFEQLKAVALSRSHLHWSPSFAAHGTVRGECMPSTMTLQLGPLLWYFTGIILQSDMHVSCTGLDPHAVSPEDSRPACRIRSHDYPPRWIMNFCDPLCFVRSWAASPRGGMYTRAAHSRLGGLSLLRLYRVTRPDVYRRDLAPTCRPLRPGNTAHRNGSILRFLQFVNPQDY